MLQFFLACCSARRAPVTAVDAFFNDLAHEPPQSVRLIIWDIGSNAGSW